MFKILLDGKQGQSYNISANNEIDNISLVKKILEIMDKSSDLINFVEDRPGHDLRYSLDSTKIRNSLGWNNKTNFDDSIRKTIDWVLNQSNIQNVQKETFDPTPWKK